MTIENEIVKKFGSPLFVLDKEMLISKFKELYNAFNKLYPTVIAYSYKTNYLPYLCNILHKQGAYAEIIPGFEFNIAKELGIKGEEIIVNGPYKPKEELREILEHGCKINIDNLDELNAVSEIANELDVVVNIGIRINTKVGELPWSKFGFNLESGEALNAIKIIQNLNNVKLVGLHFHIGTNINNTKLYSNAINNLIRFYEKIKSKIDIEYIDVGGGFASSGVAPLNIEHKNWIVPTSQEYAKAICDPIKKYFKKERPLLILEPGRFLVDEVIYLLTKVIAVKNIFGIRSVFVDAGVNILPSSYYRKHLIEPIAGNNFGNTLTDVYGPLCMQVDLLESGIPLPKIDVGDILKIRTCGAYELSHSMQFIRPRPAVVCLDGENTILIRRKENFSDITITDNWDVIK